MSAYDTETLSLGGGIVTVESIDMGFCSSFSLQIEIEKNIKYRYYKKSSGSGLIKLPVKEKSKITSMLVKGQFVCESIMYDTIQKLGLFSSLTGKFLSIMNLDFELPCYSLTFVSSPVVGKQIVVDFVDVFIEPEGSFNLLEPTTWKNVTFNFTGMLDEFESDPPELKLNTI